MKRRILSLLTTLVMVIGFVGVMPNTKAMAILQSEVESKLSSLMNQYVGSRWTSNYYGIQCKGFANLMFKELFGITYIGPYDAEKYYIPSPSGATEVGKLNFNQMSKNSAAQILQKGMPGDFIQVRRRGKSWGHSMILVNSDSNGIIVFDCNSDGNCGVKKYYITYDNFYSKNSAMSLYHAKNYEVTSSNNSNESILDYGDSFSALILNSDYWKPIMVKDNGSIVLGTENQENMRREIWKFTKNSDGSYRIQSYYNGQSLDVYDAEDKDYANLLTYDNNDGNNQKWFIVDNGDGVMLRPACSSTRVLDLCDNNSADGTPLILYTKNNSSAQKFNIYKFDPPGESKLTVTAGTSYTDTKLSWTKTNNTNYYKIKIYKDKVWNGSPYKVFNNVTDTSLNVRLPEGTYQIYVDSHNVYSYTMSNLVTVKIEKGACTHTYGSWSTTKAATCTVDGTKTRKCSSCGNVETATIKATGHKYIDKLVSPTCIAKGYTNHKCEKCGNSYNDTEKSAIGHKYGDWTTTKAATCTVNGTKTKKCSSCGNVETATIKATGHKYIDKLVSPTCTAKGYTNHKCEKCSNSYNDTEKGVIGHKYEPKDINGTSSIVCTMCNLTHQVTFKGEGTVEAPYLMSSKEDLLCLSKFMQNDHTAALFKDKCYKQTNDIDLENISWTPIGLFKINDWYTSCYFQDGFVYDGGNHSILNLNVSNSYVYSGFFGKVDRGTVKNLAVYGSLSSGKGTTGGIVGEIACGATIENCSFNGNVTGVKIGGIVGAVQNQECDANITNCYHVGEINANIVGGIASIHIKNETDNNFNINNCYFSKSSAENGLGKGGITKNTSTSLTIEMLKKVASDLGSSYINNLNNSINDGYPVFSWQKASEIKGDINNDGDVKVADIVVMQKFLTGKHTFNDAEQFSADLNEDEKINVFDMIVLKRMVMK